MSGGRIDGVDWQIVQHLAQDARMSNREIANALGIAEGTVRARIKRLQANGQIKITAVTRFAGSRQPVMAYIGVRTDLQRTSVVAERIADLPFVRFAATMLGRYDILAITLVEDGAELVRLVNKDILSLEGVRHAETTLAVKSLKYDYRWGRIIPPRNDRGAD